MGKRKNKKQVNGDIEYFVAVDLLDLGQKERARKPRMETCSVWAKSFEHAVFLAKGRMGGKRVFVRGDSLGVTNVASGMTQHFCHLSGNKHLRDDAGEVRTAIRAEMLYLARSKTLAIVGALAK